MILAESTWKEIDGLDRSMVVVAPFGAMEQHSLHLPLHTDALIAGELARRLDAALSGSLLVLPVQWLGLSPHHMDFSGTITVSYGTYIAVVLDILDSVAQHGFRKFLLLNAHGGNSSILDVALGEFSRRRPEAEAALVTYWKVAAAEIAALRESAEGGMGHACELETSLMLAASPGQVRREQMEADGLWPESQFLYHDMLSPGAVGVWHKFLETTQHGGYGDPLTASAEKGERFFDAIVKRLADVVADLQAGRLAPSRRAARA